MADGRAHRAAAPWPDAGRPAHDSIPLEDRSRDQARDGSRNQFQHQRGHGQQEESDRQAECGE